LHQWDPEKADGEVDIFDEVGAIGDLDDVGGDADAAAGIEPPSPPTKAPITAAAAAVDVDEEAALLDGDTGKDANGDGGVDGAMDADTGALSAYDEAELQAMLAELG